MYLSNLGLSAKEMYYDVFTPHTLSRLPLEGLSDAR
jgi:hypothetical protein